MAEFSDEDVMELLAQEYGTGDVSSDIAGEPAPPPRTGIDTGAAPIFTDQPTVTAEGDGIPAQLQESSGFQRMSGAFQSGNIDKYILPGGGFNWDLMEQDAQEMRASLNWSNTLFEIGRAHV